MSRSRNYPYKSKRSYRSRKVAGILALFTGALGLHKFYLRRPKSGIFYLILVSTGISTLLAIYDALRLFTMDQNKFDYLYNEEYYDYHLNQDHKTTPHNKNQRRTEPDFDRRLKKQTRLDKRKQPNQNSKNLKKVREYSSLGKRHFKNYDYGDAIESFEKAIQLDPTHVASHFNLACTYSLLENKDKVMHHLDLAVKNGFTDFQKIKEHNALAWFRIHDSFEDFQAKGFILSPAEPELQKQVKQQTNILESKPDLLDQLQKLSKMRKKGLISENEYTIQKRKLMQ